MASPPPCGDASVGSTVRGEKLVIALLRRARILHKPKVGREAAEALARAESQRQGWPWEGQIHVAEGLRSWAFRTNTEYRGGNVIVVVDSRSGRIRRAFFASR